MNTMTSEHDINSMRAEKRAERIPLHLDSLDQRLDLLMATLRTLCQKIGPVLSDTPPSEGEAVMPTLDEGLSAVCSRISHMDDQVQRMINEVEYVINRVEL